MDVRTICEKGRPCSIVESLTAIHSLLCACFLSVDPGCRFLPCLLHLASVLSRVGDELDHRNDRVRSWIGSYVCSAREAQQQVRARYPLTERMKPCWSFSWLFENPKRAFVGCSP